MQTRFPREKWLLLLHSVKALPMWVSDSCVTGMAKTKRELNALGDPGNSAELSISRERASWGQCTEKSLLLFRALHPYLAIACKLPWHWRRKGFQIFFWYLRNLWLKAIWGFPMVQLMWAAQAFPKIAPALLPLPGISGTTNLTYLNLFSLQLNQWTKWSVYDIAGKMGCVRRERWKEDGVCSFWLGQTLSLRNHIPDTSKQLLSAWDCPTHSLADPNTPLILRQFSGFFVLPELMIIRHQHIYCAILHGLGNSRMDLIN